MKETSKPMNRPGRSFQYTRLQVKTSQGCRRNTWAEILVSFEQRPIWECDIAIRSTLVVRKVSFEFHMDGHLELSIHLIRLGLGGGWLMNSIGRRSSVKDSEFIRRE